MRLKSIIKAVLFWTRFPTPFGEGAGATDRCGKLTIRRHLLELVLVVFLLAFASVLEGVVPMMTAVAIELAVHLAITVGSRV